MKSAGHSKRSKVKRVPLLVLEPDADQWLLIRAALIQSMPEVEPLWFNHTSQVLAFLQNSPTDSGGLPCLILMEISFPDQPAGLHLLEMLKTHPFSKNIPVILLSPTSDELTVAQAYNLGAASYQIKPTSYNQWLVHFYTFRRYWWEVVTLPTRS